MTGKGALEGTQYELELPRGSTIKALRYVSDGRLFAVSTLKHGPPQELEGLPNVVQVWEIGRSEPLCEWVASGNGWNRIAIHPQGSSVAISTDSDLSLWAVPHAQQLWQERTASLANGIEFSPDGRMLATVGPYGERDNLAFVDLWNSDTGTNLFSASPGIQSCDFVTFSRDGAQFAVSGIHEDPSIGSLLIWTTDGRNLVNREHERGGQSSICYSPDGRFVVTDDGIIHFWDAANGDLVRTLKAKDEIYGVVHFHPRDSTLVTTVKPLERMGIDLPDDELLRLFAEDADPFGTLIIREVEKRKGRLLTLGEVVRLELESGRELDRRRIHLSYPSAGSGYYGGGSTVSQDGTRFAIALHTSIEVWSLDGDAID